MLRQLTPLESDYSLPELSSSMRTIYTARAALQQPSEQKLDMDPAHGLHLPQGTFGTDGPSKQGMRNSIFCRRDGHCLSDSDTLQSLPPPHKDACLTNTFSLNVSVTFSGFYLTYSSSLSKM